MFASDVSGFDGLRTIVESPHGAQVIALDLSNSFAASAGRPVTTAQPVRGFSLAI